MGLQKGPGWIWWLFIFLAICLFKANYLLSPRKVALHFTLLFEMDLLVISRGVSSINNVCFKACWVQRVEGLHSEESCFVWCG